MKKTLKPRAIKRLTDRESAKIGLKYQQLCQAFMKALFEDPTKDEETYTTILDRFCKQWKKICHELRDKLKILVPNVDCFYNEFKPAI